MSREVVLVARPQGEPRASDFELRDAVERDPGPGEVAVRNVLVSVDPYMPSTCRRSLFGMSVIWDEIFCSALIKYSGAPVIRAEPRSAQYSR